jgi:LmbE family N-acetylglucosaminyl deacetylase
MKVVFILAHPDDESFGPGGTIAKLSKEHDVQVFSLCNGARPGNEQVSNARVQSFYQACDLLGAKGTIYNVPDLTLTYPTAVSNVEGIINQMKPDVVYTHNISDVNMDHRIIAEACIVACRPKPTSSVTQLYFTEVPASTDWSFSKLQPTFEPNTYVDISEHISLKKQALSLYLTETYAYPDARSIEAMEIRAKFRGTQIGVNFAEAFQLVFSRS